MPEVDRVYGQEYKLDLSDDTNVLSQYTNGSLQYPNGNNRGEFPYRSIIRGDFESKHCGDVSWAALQKFKTHLLDKVLSYKGKKLPKSIWQKALNNYIYNRVQEIEQEKKRYSFQSSWSQNFNSTNSTTNYEEGPLTSTTFSGHRFLSVGSLLSFTYEWSPNISVGFQNIVMRRQKRVSFVEETIDDVCYKYVGKDGVDKANPFDLNWDRDPLWTVLNDPLDPVVKQSITVLSSNSTTKKFTANYNSEIVVGKIIEFTTAVFGGVTTAGVYYIRSVENSGLVDDGAGGFLPEYSSFTISECTNGPILSLTSASGSMTALVSTLPISPTLTGNYIYDRLGEGDEFSLYFPQYESLFTASTAVTQTTYDEFGTPIVTTLSYTFTGNEFSDVGLLDDIKQHITQLADLRYDYSNLDEILTKEWLYLKLSTPNIEELGINEVVSSYPYYNEVYIDNKLADVYLLFVLDQNPTVPNDGGGYCDPDFLVRDKWKTREPGKGLLTVDGVALSKIRPQSHEYQYRDKILIYQRSNNPKIHGANDPKLVSGVEYEFLDKFGQPNKDVKSKFKFVPMRLKLQSQNPIRDEYILFLDSTAYDTQNKIQEVREKVLEAVLDKRLTYYDQNPGTNNRVIVDYNVNVTKEFPWMADLL